MVKSMVKRLLPILLAVIMLFSLPLQALAAADERAITDYETFVTYLAYLEELASIYVQENPGEDPLELMIKYIRTGVDRYNTGSWNIMAGYENEGFAKFVQTMQDEINATAPDPSWYIYFTDLKNIKNFNLPSGEYADIGHMFGTMDITYYNKNSQNHADVAGWAGDLVDLLELSDKVEVSGSIEEMVSEITENYFLADPPPLMAGFSHADFRGDLDALTIMSTLTSVEYEYGLLTNTVMSYFMPELSDAARASFFLENRLDGATTRTQVRNAVYETYLGNKVIATLEATREFKSDNLVDLRRACCYAFADYVCKLAGDYVDSTENDYYSVFKEESSALAPGITQEIKYATSADNKQMVYYLATADLRRDDVHFYANYKDNDPSNGWGMQRVEDQANAAQAKYGDPESEYYIENYNVIAATNGAGYNMTTGEPGGVLVMGGVEYQKPNSHGFIGILKDGTPVIGTTEEYNTTYKGQVQEAIACFGATLVKDGKLAVSPTANYEDGRASRTAAGITKTGKIVLMVLDGRQEPFSCGGAMIEIAQIMLEAGCVHAVNLDGGGSSTYVAKQEGDDKLSLINRPSDGYARSVSTSLMLVSTAPSSTAFDHAVLEVESNYITKNSTTTIKPIGVSATGNVAELPENLSWSVSDETCATVSEDGTFTALSEGSVEVYLMSNGAIVGSQTMDIVVPQYVKFEKTTIDAVYGAKTELPVTALYQNRKVIINPSDVNFTLDKEKAGTVNGFTFVGNENSGVKVLKITAALTANAESVAAITINLYKQGEASFDFDQATGGDRQLAWSRTVSNSTTDDNIQYFIKNPNEKMETSYIVALDMTTIPIPKKLEDLTGMLPGADVEGASAWTFLLSLAERISTLTSVTAELEFDSRLEVDYSEVTLINDYFTLESITLDESTNKLTMVLRWIDQTAAIDPATADPLCILNGIKLTPKADADWGTNGRINVVNRGSIGYEAYMRASALYTFANNEENQQIYGIYPFINPNDSSEKGGYFGEVYKDFNDTYSLIKSLKNGWFNEDGGFAFYVEGVRYSGIKKVGDYYYDFGDNGINIGQTKYTGLVYDEKENAYYYSNLGVCQSGWHHINDEMYYFDPATKEGVKGHVKLNGIYYDFDIDGRLISGVWVNAFKGWRYYYGPTYYSYSWHEIDGESYYFRDGFRITGIANVSSKENKAVHKWYNFGADGICRDLEDGPYTDIDGTKYYFVNGKSTDGLYKIDGNYYFYLRDGQNGGIITNQTYYVWKTNCDIPCGTYTFDAEGKLVNGFVEKADGLYYYVNGKEDRSKIGLNKIDGDYYFFDYDGKCATGRIYAWETNCDLPCAYYEFGADGKMLDGIVEKDGGLYYYEKGQPKMAGLINIDGDYYFACDGKGTIVTNQVYYNWKDNGLLPANNYEFGPDGKMLDGIVEKDGGLYYYETGRPKMAGLINIDGDYYFAYDGKGTIITNQVYYNWKGNGLLPANNYEFGPDGKMLNGIVEKDGGLYYYETGRPKMAGLINIDGDYYFAYDGKGTIITNQVYYNWKGNGLLPENNYEYGPDGKMLNGIVEKDGGLYYYETGRPKMAGLINIDGDYYFACDSKGTIVTNQVYYNWKGNGLLPENNYEFGPDGKMLNGIVEKDGGLYYYSNGRAWASGLVEVDGNYYFACDGKGTIVTDCEYYVWDGNGILPEGRYHFDAEGKLRNGFVEKADGIYYYVNGKPGKVGINYIDGYYYFVNYDGKLVTDCKYYVWEANELLAEQNYIFNELGQIIG